jgi:DNA-binding transcriptional MerR regulator
VKRVKQAKQNKLNQLTLDELARAAGTTGRNVRAFQTQGLLPRPDLVGRTGYYGPGHLERLKAILRLQGEGFSLASIALLFRAVEAGMTLEQVLGLAPRASSGESEDELFSGWPNTPRGQLLSVVPTNLLGLPSAS